MCNNFIGRPSSYQQGRVYFYLGTVQFEIESNVTHFSSGSISMLELTLEWLKYDSYQMTPLVSFLFQASITAMRLTAVVVTGEREANVNADDGKLIP